MRDLTKGNIYKSFFTFAIPLILSGLLSQAYNLIDNVIAGRFLGQCGLAAVGATSQLITLVSCIFSGFAVGFGIYMARLFGSKEYKKIKSDVYNIVIILSAALILLGVLFALFSGTVMDVMKISDDIRHNAQIYFCIYMAGFFTMVLNSAFVQMMNSLGISSFPLIMSVLSAVLNVTGNILSVTVFDLGVAGIAASTVIAATATDICYLVKLRACFIQLGVKDEKIRISFSAVKHSWRYALPTSIQQGSMYISSLAIQPMVNGLGSAVAASYTIILRIYNINASVYHNASKTLSNFSAQCIGAGKYDKIGHGLRVGLLQNLAFTVPIVLICSLCAESICSVFFPSGFVGQSLDITVHFAQIYLPFILFNLVNNFFHSFFRGIGAMGLLIAVTAIASALRLAASFILANRFGMDGILTGWVISWIGEAVIMLVIYLVKFRNSGEIRKYVMKRIACL